MDRHVSRFLLALSLGIGLAAPAWAMRSTGKVKWFDAAKGFGFITMDNGEDVFVRSSSIQTKDRCSLSEGSHVEFDLFHGPKGIEAKNVVNTGGCQEDPGAPINPTAAPAPPAPPTPPPAQPAPPDAEPLSAPQPDASKPDQAAEATDETVAEGPQEEAADDVREDEAPADDAQEDQPDQEQVEEEQANDEPPPGA